MTVTATTGKSKADRHPAATNRANAFGPMCSVRLVYEDDPTIPVSERDVLYWVFDSKGKDLESDPVTLDFWARQSLLMPGGCLQTDADGVPLKGVWPLSQLQLAKDSQGSWRFTYSRLPGIPATRAPSTPAMFPMARFPAGRKVAFLLLPPDIIEFFTTLDLVKLQANAIVNIVDVKQDGQEVKIHSTFPEWLHRIDRLTGLVQGHLDEFKSYAVRHFQATAELQLMSHFVWLMARFPEEKRDPGETARALGLMNDLDDLHNNIKKRYLDNSDQSTECGKHRAAVNGAAKGLVDTLKNAAFHQEFMRYGDSFLNTQTHSPETVLETASASVCYEILGRAYAALAMTDYGVQIFDEQVEPLIGYFAQVSGEAHPEWTGPDEDGPIFDELRNSLAAPPPAISKNPLLMAVDKFGTIVQTVISDAPGLPSLFETLLNNYGFYVSRYFNGNHPKEAARLMRSLWGFLEKLSGGKPLTSSQKGMLTKAAKKTWLRKDGRKVLLEYTDEILKGTPGEARAQALHCSMVIFSLVSLLLAVDATSTEVTVRNWLLIAGAGSNVALTIFGEFLVKIEAHPPPSFKVARFGMRALAFVGAAATIIISGQEMLDLHEKKGWNLGMFYPGLTIIATLLLTIGFILSETPVGWLCCLIGSILSVGLLIWDLVKFIISIFHKNTESAFEAMLEEFAENKKNAYPLEYCKVPDLKRKYDAIVKEADDMKWWLMSWRAIVPLYEGGYFIDPEAVDKDYGKDRSEAVQKKWAENTVVTARSIELIVSDDVGSYKVTLKIMWDYLRLKETGSEEVVKWQRGDAWPDKSPSPESTALQCQLM